MNNCNYTIFETLKYQLEFIKKYQGVFGELDFMYANTLIPNFDEDEEFEDEEDYEEW